MNAFTLGELEALRGALKRKRTMRSICALMKDHSRDEVVEAIDALHRTRSFHDAQRHVNFVLNCQNAGIPMVNGRPFDERARRPVGMF